MAWKIAVAGGHIQVYVDDEIIIDVTDPAPIDSAGAIALHCDGLDKTSFDNVKVSVAAAVEPEEKLASTWAAMKMR